MGSLPCQKTSRMRSEPWSELAAHDELAQAQGRGVPRYITVNEEGPDHSPVFTVEVQLYGRTLGMGIGRSKKSAEQMAASKALDRAGFSIVATGLALAAWWHCAAHAS